jgi:hypothetical protein
MLLPQKRWKSMLRHKGFSVSPAEIDETKEMASLDSFVGQNFCNFLYFCGTTSFLNGIVIMTHSLK